MLQIPATRKLANQRHLRAQAGRAACRGLEASQSSPRPMRPGPGRRPRGGTAPQRPGAPGLRRSYVPVVVDGDAVVVVEPVPTSTSRVIIFHTLVKVSLWSTVPSSAVTLRTTLIDLPA